MKHNIKLAVIFVAVVALVLIATGASAYYIYNDCNSHAYRLCDSNNVYWYDSCGNRQDLYQNCYGQNQTCQYGQCVYQESKPYVSHYMTACYGNNLYWYDSLGSLTGFYKTCNDSNSCTIDTCYSGACSNVVKCDGSTCSLGTSDYVKYCASDKSHCGNKKCEKNLGETAITCVVDCEIAELSVLFFVKQDPASIQWQKLAQVGQNSQLYFEATVENTGSVKTEDVIVFTEIPSEIFSLGNLQIDGVSVARDIVAGVNIGELEPGLSKTLTFEGKTQLFTTQAIKEAIIKIEADKVDGSDSVDIEFNPSQSGGATISGGTNSAFWEFLKRRYLWILIGAVLLFLFVVVFRRLSTNA